MPNAEKSFTFSRLLDFEHVYTGVYSAQLKGFISHVAGADTSIEHIKLYRVVAGGAAVVSISTDETVANAVRRF